MTVKAPYLPYDKLRTCAAEFLAQHHPSGTVPTPIAAIVEFQFGMDIVPIPGLRDLFEVDSSISNDLTTIYVDEFVFNKRSARYHFSLAHELSHRLIHGEVFRQLVFRNLAEWKRAITSIPPDQYNWIEWQAYSLAGLILVPSGPLRAAYDRTSTRAALAGVVVEDADVQARRIVAASLAKEFCVSADVIQKRLKYDRIWQ